MTQPQHTPPTQGPEASQQAMPLAQLWHDYSEVLRRFLAARVHVRADVDDLLHDILLRSHQKLPTLRSVEALRGWLFMIARRVVVDYYRSTGKEVLWSGDDDIASLEPHTDANETDEAHDALGQELTQCVQLFLSQLPPKYKQALEAVELEGKSQKQVAAALGISYSGLKSRVQRGRQMMEGLFRSCCHIELDARGQVIGAEARRACGPCG